MKKISEIRKNGSSSVDVGRADSRAVGVGARRSNVRRVKTKTSIKRATRKRSGQTSFLPNPKDTFFGPERAPGRNTHAKVGRPLSSQKPIHVCFRSKFAKGKRTMLGANKIRVNALVAKISQRYHVTLQKYVNVGNHLHLVVKLSGSTMTARRRYRTWIRLLTSRIAFEVGGSKKGEPFKDENGDRVKFWDAIPFSRIIHGRRGWRSIDRYVLKNEFEARGHSKDHAIRMAREIYDSEMLMASEVSPRSKIFTSG